MNCKQRIAFSSLLLLAVFLGVPVLLTWRAVRQEKLDRALFAAIRAESNQALVSLLEQGADPNARAAPHANRSFLRVFLDMLSGRRELPATALIYAAYRGDATIVDTLAAHGADVNVRTFDGSTALHFAATNGWSEVTKTLLDKGADVNARNDHSTTPLMFAARWGYSDTVRVLLERGADPNAKDKTGKTALKHVSESHAFKMELEPGEYKKVIQMLKQAGAKE